MPITLEIDGLPAGAVRGYTLHVHAEITRSTRRADPREVGRSRHEPFSVTRGLDHLSPHLLRACSEGRMLDRVVLTVRRPEEDDVPPESFQHVLERVIVTSVVSSFEADGPLETVTLDYGTIHWTHTSPDGEVRASWTVFGTDA